MLLGIDVGGTYTDAVLIKDKVILAQGKSTTTHGEVLKGILAVLDKVLENQPVETIERVVISSTIVTNALTEGKTSPVDLIVMPGPGMNIKTSFPIEPQIITGYVDHRGKITAPAGTKEVQVKEKNVAISGKFSVRNPENEHLLANTIKEKAEKIFLGSELSGELNFIRRTNSAYYSATVADTFDDFCKHIENSLKERNITAPVQILKADGGTLPITAIQKQPVDSIFTGPAASVLGIMALTPPKVNCISFDVGGTTTDIAFWENGKPLLAKNGASINGYPTAARAFHMRSVGIGGDSIIRKESGGFTVGPERFGPSMAVGGTKPALADALVVLKLVDYGNYDKACEALKQFADANETVEEVAKKVLEVALVTIEKVIAEMLYEWSIQPVYTVDDVVKGTEFVPSEIIGVGGGATGLIDALGDRLNLSTSIPTGGMVANAIGAALAKPTLSASLRADTTEGFYIIPESDIHERIPSGFGLAKATDILEKELDKKCAELGISKQKAEVIASEYFHTMHSYYEVGEIIYLRMQLQPGILFPIEGREVVF